MICYTYDNFIKVIIGLEEGEKPVCLDLQDIELGEELRGFKNSI